jgi:hypothetical protein
MRYPVFAVLSALAIGGSGAPAGAQSESDWPCIQPRVAQIGIAQMWSGPALESAGDWHADPEIAQLVPVLAARRMPVEQAGATIAAFAATVGPGKNQRLTLLFAGLFDDMNASRARMIAGIEGYARRQRELAQRINDTRTELTARSGMPDQTWSDIEQKLAWDTRIYDERAQSITYVCETPVRIEQRLFGLARIIQNDMD